MTADGVPSPWQDLWELPTQRQTASLSDEIERNFYARCSPDKRPVEFRNLDSDPPTTSRPSTAIDDDEELEKGGADPEKVAPADDEVKTDEMKAGPKRKSKQKPKYDASLVKALHVTFFWRFWAGGILK